MSDERKDGGPAFPAIDNAGFVEFGMSLRQWYKGKALMALIQVNEMREPGDGMPAGQIATVAGEYADAMIDEDTAAAEAQNG